MPANPGSVSGAGAGIRECRALTKIPDPGFHRGDDFYENVNFVNY